MYKIMGQYRNNEGAAEVIDAGFHTKGYARRMLAEYIIAFGTNWGPMWIVDRNGFEVE